MLRSLMVLSLLLCVATVGLWVRSYWRQDGVRYNSKVSADLRIVDIFCASDTGQILFEHSTWRVNQQPTFRLPFDGIYSQQVSGLVGDVSWMRNMGSYWRGFGVMSGLHGSTTITMAPTTYTQTSMFRLIFPHWAMAIAFAVLPAVLLARKLRSRSRLTAGLCPVCGYDLRATPDRCPECGTAASR